MARSDIGGRVGVIRDVGPACSFQARHEIVSPGTGDRRGRDSPGRAAPRTPPGSILLRLPERSRHQQSVEGGRRPRRGNRRGRRAAPPVAPAAAIPAPSASRVETPRPGIPSAHRQAFGGGDPDPQAGERARPEPDRDQVHRPPAARRVGAALDLGEEPGRVARPAAVVQPELGLGEDLAVAPGAGGGVEGRGVEADDDQEIRPLVPTSRERRWRRLLAVDEPGHLVTTDAGRGDLVDVQRPLVRLSCGVSVQRCSQFGNFTQTTCT